MRPQQLLLKLLAAAFLWNINIVLVEGKIQNNSSTSSCADLYRTGVDSYLNERWMACIENMNAAIEQYKRALMAVADCRIRCVNEPFQPLLPKDVDNMHFYEQTIKRTLCFIRCKNTHYPDVMFDFDSERTIEKIMEDLTPYTYLHICYFNKNLMQKAASATFTYLVKHPDDKLMKQNFDYYISLPEVDIKEITNYEVEEYIPLYLHGMNSYSSEDWQSVIAYMEEALHAYIAADQRCRALCEGSFDQGWLPDFVASVSNHFTFCLKCKRKCEKKLKSLDGAFGTTVLSDIYNYLQFAYYKMEKYEEAGRTVASYLIMNPDDEDMIQNKKFYSKNLSPTMFVPRPELEYYIMRDNYEKKLLNFIQNSFTAELEINKMNHHTNSKDIINNEV